AIAHARFTGRATYGLSPGELASVRPSYYSARRELHHVSHRQARPRRGRAERSRRSPRQESPRSARRRISLGGALHCVVDDALLYGGGVVDRRVVHGLGGAALVAVLRAFFAGRVPVLGVGGVVRRALQLVVVGLVDVDEVDLLRPGRSVAYLVDIIACVFECLGTSGC